MPEDTQISESREAQIKTQSDLDRIKAKYRPAAPQEAAEFDRWMKVAERIMHRYRDGLRQLAKR